MSISSLTQMNATELMAQLQRGEVSSVEIAQAFLECIQRHDAGIHAFLWTDPELTLSTARRIDDRRARGQALGCLAGLPFATKDIVCTKGLVTSCGSRMLANYRPPYQATVMERLEAADGILLGKTNLDEFAMGGSTEDSAFGATSNPWDTTRVPGGSSGGSAACVAACMAPLSIGSDTGGSIRQPAAFCGIVGLKPTYGRVSRYGLVAFASSLDQLGPMAWTVADVALLLESMAGHDQRDSTSANVPVPPYSQLVQQPLQKLRLGICPAHFDEGLDPQVAALIRSAIDVYRSLGAEIRELDLPHSRYAIAAYYIVAPSEASSNLARYDGVHYGYRVENAEEESAYGGADRDEGPLVRMYRRSRAQGFGAEVKRRIMLGTYALSSGYYDAYYLKALKVRRLIRDDYERAFRDVDFLIGPATPTPAFKLGAMANDPLALYLQDLYTVSANLAGVPSISIPCGFTSEGLPVGLQLQGPVFQEDRLLRAAHMYQQVTDWHTRRPALQ